jgi:aconitate hydratase
MKKDLLGIERELTTSSGTYKYFSLAELEKKGYNIAKMPFSIRILVENVIRNYDDLAVVEENVQTILGWKPKPEEKEIPYTPARVLMQDFTGVPAVVDMASLRAEVIRKGKDGNKINPLVPVDLVIDHSVQVEFFGTKEAESKNVALEYEQNVERYKLLKWAQQAFQDFGITPPGMGICHQVNLEYLSKAVITRNGYAFPDTLVGTDSHTPMVNGIGVLGWGVGGIEAEAAMLGQPSYMLLPEVIGLKLTGQLPEGTTATDMVLTITELLRKYGVVGKFVEVFGEGLDTLAVPDRATISNMSPEFGCTATFFPIDDRTLEYLEKTGRSKAQIEVVEKYCKANMLWRENESSIAYTHVLELDLSTVLPTLSGPKRPQDKVLMKDMKTRIAEILKKDYGRDYIDVSERKSVYFSKEDDGDVAVATDNKLKSTVVRVADEEYVLSDASVVIAAITSCTNTSNPSVMLGAGLVAKKAVEKGLSVKPWVKTSLAPGSKVVTRYLEKAGLLEYLEAMRFHVVGYGCTTCIGNSGTMPKHIADAISKEDLVVSAVLSGNRNFEARIHPQVKMNFLASPMLVVAYAIAGRTDIDLTNEPIGYDPNKEPVYLKDIWPTPAEIQDTILGALSADDYFKTYSTASLGDEQWQRLDAPTGENYVWDPASTYVQEAPFFANLPENPSEPADIKGAKVLLALGDSITTDHISPAGSFKEDSPAGKYLIEKGVTKKDFNSYGARRGNHEVMMRGTFANVRIKNKLATKEGGFTTYLPTGEEMSVYDASMKYQAAGTPLVVLGGKEYGNGSSRDWAAKGTFLLGVKAVIAESFERIHRSNLVGMGVLPLEFTNGQSYTSLGLDGTEEYSIEGISAGLKPRQILQVTATKKDGSKVTFEVFSRLDSKIEIEYYKHGGILQYVLRNFLKA